MVRVGFGKKMLAALAVAAIGFVAGNANAATITFANFAQTNAGATPWTFTNSGATSSLTASNVLVNFTGATAPTNILNFQGLFGGTTGTVLASITAVVNGVATQPGGPGTTITQGVGVNTPSGLADLKFVSQSNPADVILEVKFVGAISGSDGGTGSIGGASTVSGQVVQYSTNHLGGSFVAPFAFSLTLDGPLGINANGYLNSFNTSSTGIFRSDSAGAGNSTPLPAAAWGGLSLMGALGIGAMARRRRAV
jgi:hypothetical protein